MRRSRSSVTYRLRIKGELVQVQIAPSIYRRMEQRAATEDTPVEEVIRDYLAPLVPAHGRQRRLR